MSPPRRRRRRRGRGSRPEAAQSPNDNQAESQTQPDHGSEQAQRSRARGRRRGRGGEQRRPASPLLSEDLVRALPKERPEQLTAPPDGQTLEALIGDLQSEWGVPQYPQEYRITLRVADERDVRTERAVTVESAERDPNGDVAVSGVPRREKAPAAPRVGAVDRVERQPAPKRRRGRRRRRRGKDVDGTASADGTASTAGAPPSTALESEANGPEASSEEE
jgi:hypothetical protein